MRRSISGRNADGIRQPEAYMASSEIAKVVIMQACLPRQTRQIKNASAHEKTAQTKQETSACPIEKEGTMPIMEPIIPTKLQPTKKISHWQIVAAEKSASAQNESDSPRRISAAGTARFGATKKKHRLMPESKNKSARPLHR